MEILRIAEEKFLLAAEWERADAGLWLEPEPVVDYVRRILEFGHAVNSEKLHGLERGTHDREALVALMREEVAYLLRNGWVPADEDVHRRGSWLEPAGRHCQRRTRPQHKALNSQKQWDRVTVRAV
jgi:hypothetical protein